ncbi:MAG: type II secretion system protein [Geobacter sp.]|nr:type II secretion system protein [Geobacter sp.]
MRNLCKIFFLLCSLAFIAGCAGGRSAFSKAQKLEEEGKLDEAVVRYVEAIKESPDSSEYRLRFLKIKADAAKLHFQNGERLFEEKKFNEALQEYQAALALDPTLERAQQQSVFLAKKRDSLFFYNEAQEFEKARKQKEAYRSYLRALELDPANQDARTALDGLLKSKKPKLDGFELNLKSTKPITLKFKDAKIKDVFNILTQLSGINFIFDEGIKDQNITIYLENATFQQSLDIVCGLNKLGRKVLNESTIVIYPKTPDKAKQYEELIVQTFYLTNADAKKIVNLLRTMLQLRKIYVNEELNAVVIRDTPEMLEVAQKILDANDMPDAELILEVEVIEVSKDDNEKFGLLLSAYGTSFGAGKGDKLFATSLTSTTGTAVGDLLKLSSGWGQYGAFFTVPTASYDFGKTLTNGQVLSNPRLRVKNREKAKFTVGDRIPITTTTTANATTSVNVQYVDVGVKVNVEPTIQPNNEINLKMSLEVSSAGTPRTVGGADSQTQVVDISNRNLDTVLSLKDGETTIIGGLLSNRKGTSKKKIFLLGDIPFLGPLISNTEDTNKKNELVLAITPRIIRAVSMPDTGLAAFWSGREDDPSTKKAFGAFEQEPEFSELAPEKPAIPVEKAPLAPGQPPMPGKPEQPAPPKAVEPEQRGALSVTAPEAVPFGTEFEVEIQVADVKNLYSAPFTLTYDPIFLEFVALVPGPFMSQDGNPVELKTQHNPGDGTVAVTFTRTGKVEGVSGAGSFMKSMFKAKNMGPGNIGLKDVGFTAPDGKPLQVVPYGAVVDIREPPQTAPQQAPQQEQQTQ